MTGPPTADVADGYYSPRELTYITPAGRRLSDYEAAICHVQPDVDHYDFGGWLQLAPDGKSLFEASSTRLRHPDWFQYRDPSALWQRTYMRQQAVEERAVAGLLDSTRANGYLADVDGFWARDILARHYQAYGCYEWGLFLALNRAIRLALSDTLTMMITFTAIDRLRHQQSIAVYGLELEQELGGIAEGLGKEAWLGDPVHQPARWVVERLMAADDWCEIVVVCGLLVDPLLSTLVGRHFFRRFASVNGDPVTPVIAITAERDRLRYLRAVRSLVEMVTAETDRSGRPVPAAANRAVIQDWIDDWVPPVRAALDAFLPVFDLPTMRPVVGEEARDVVVKECAAELERFDLELRW
ncbi:MAG TPA: monooxygenase [Actinomycetota bacterium]|nr:monooxygenase [Actinomycetota bacterium]